MALLFAASASLDFLPPEILAKMPMGLYDIRDELTFALMVEGGFLLAQGTLVDIATRLKKRPPLWVAALIVIGVMIFSQGTMDVIRVAWQQGSVVFVPFLLSIAERGAVLWRMPSRPEIEKIAARALISNRIVTGLGLFGLATVALLVGVATGLFDFSAARGWPALLAGAIYFGVAAFDDWRVRGAKFAQRPRVLFGYDAIGIKYLEPV